MNTVVNSNQNFTSRLYPVQPFTIKTKVGKLYVKEVRSTEKKNFCKELTKIFVKNIAANSDDPAWKILLENTEVSKKVTKWLKNYLKMKLDGADENLTLLVAYDKNKKMEAACMSFGFDQVPSCQNTVCYIESISVNNKYKGMGVGKILIDKTLESAKKSFTDAFLVSVKPAKEFYKKLGFKQLSPDDKNQKAVIDYIAIDRRDYPNYVHLFTKPLQLNKPRWYDQIAGQIKEINKFYE